MSDMFNDRQERILIEITYGREYAASQIGEMLGVDNPSSATLRRDLDDLEKRGFLFQKGERRGTSYGKTVLGALVSPYDAKEYFSKNEQMRNGLSSYIFDLFAQQVPPFLESQETKQLDTATRSFVEKSARSSDVAEKELERFVIELSWKSSQIEGNTYTLLDTERLLREGIPAKGKTEHEAQMILNHKDAFAFSRENPVTALSLAYVEEIHRLLVRNLGVAKGLRKGEVGITGATYRPLVIPQQLVEQLALLCERVNELHDPYSKALLALTGISYLQAFADGNKRTARLVANALMIGAGCAPLSYRTTDEISYKESMLTFYEQLSIVPMKKIFIEQYLFACEQYLRV
jgi:Fic family protein